MRRSVVTSVMSSFRLVAIRIRSTGSRWMGSGNEYASSMTSMVSGSRFQPFRSMQSRNHAFQCCGRMTFLRSARQASSPAVTTDANTALPASTSKSRVGLDKRFGSCAMKMTAQVSSSRFTDALSLQRVVIVPQRVPVVVRHHRPRHVAANLDASAVEPELGTIGTGRHPGDSRKRHVAPADDDLLALLDRLEVLTQVVL